MASAATRTFLTVEQFEILAEDQEPHLEYWFGEASPKEVPNTVHGIFQWVLAMVLDRMGWKSSTEVRLKLSNLAEPIPDVIADAKHLESPYPTEAFGLCVEVVSPKDDLAKLFRKGAHYLDWKIETVWIIDPEKRNAFVMTRQSPAPEEISAGGVLTATSGENTLELPLNELLAETDKRL